MPNNQVDAFFTIANVGPGVEQTGFVVRGDQVGRYGWVSGRMLDADAVPLEQRWPLLAEAFREGFDATLTTSLEDPWTWVFRGADCLRLHPVDGTVAELGTIANRFPGLPATFASGIDAALPGPSGNQVYLFRGDTCVLYDMRVPVVVETKSLATMWAQLEAEAPGFVDGIGAATFDPKSGEFHFFLGDHYTTGVLATRTVTRAADTVNDTSWPGLVPALHPGFLYRARLSGRYSVPEVFDLRTQEAWAPGLALTASPGLAVTASPDHRYVYLHSYSGRHCLETATGTLVAEFSEQNSRIEPSGMAFSGDGERSYFVTRTTPDRDPYLMIAHTGTFDSAGSIPLPGYGNPYDLLRAPIAVSPDGETAYLGIGTRDRTSVVVEVDVCGNAIVREFEYDNAGSMHDIALAPDGTVVHVAHDKETLAIDVRSGVILRRGKLPVCRRLAFAPNRDELYCLPAGDAATGLLVADPVNHEILHRIPILADGGLGRPGEIAFSRNGTYAYVAESDDVTIAIINIARHRRVRAVELADGSTQGLSGLAYTPLLTHGQPPQ